MPLRVLELLAIEDALAGEEHLRRIDGLDEVVGDVAPDRLVHEALLLALGDEDHGHPEITRLDLIERGEATEARHHLVEEHEIETRRTERFERILAVRDRHDLEPLLLEEADVGREEFDFVVGPQHPSLGFVRSYGDCSAREAARRTAARHSDVAAAV